MKLQSETLSLGEFFQRLKKAVNHDGQRLATLTSRDGTQLVALLLDTTKNDAALLTAGLEDRTYPTLASEIPSTHWFERALHDMFGIVPVGHPRLKPAMLNEFSGASFAALLPEMSERLPVTTRDISYLHVRGDDIFEIAVGPVHAGIIEPGHFRFNCLGELIVNLEIRLGFLHRGLERRLTEIPWQKARFAAESAASDTACANALAHAIAIEHLAGITPPARAQYLRGLALETERLAMHIADVGGMATDVGFLAVSAALSRLRGRALRMAELLSGSRYLRAYVMPGGVSEDPAERLLEIRRIAAELEKDLNPYLDRFLDDAVVHDRTHNVGRVPASLARDFGFVGVAARASGIAYDVRHHFAHGMFPACAPEIAVAEHGDIYSRTQIRVMEIRTSFGIITRLIDEMPAGPIAMPLPSRLEKNAQAAGIVEAFRGELIHLIFTDEHGNPSRYHIKDPSANNWTALAIAARNNLVADFPICNKSFSLSYSGHDL